MCRFKSHCEQPPTQKKRHKEDAQESNRNYEKTKDHEHFKTVGRKGDHGRPRTFLFALIILEIQGHLMFTWATKNSRKLGRLATKHWSYVCLRVFAVRISLLFYFSHESFGFFGSAESVSSEISSQIRFWILPKKVPCVGVISVTQ